MELSVDIAAIECSVFEAREPKFAAFGRHKAENFLREYYVSTPSYVLGKGVYSSYIIDAIGCDFIIDDFTNEKTFFNKKICRLADVKAGSHVISCAMHSPLTAQRVLSERRLKNISYYELQAELSYLKLPKLEYWVSNETIENKKTILKELFHILDDDLSRDIAAKTIAFRETGNLKYMYGFENTLDQMYFEDFLQLSEECVFYDIGALDGKNSIDFAKAYPKYGGIVAVEPMSTSYAKVKNNLLSFQKVKTLNAAVSDNAGFAKIYQGNSGSYASASLSSDDNKTSELVTTLTVDEIVEMTNDIPEFIKMDIEGEEIKALHGAKNTITNIKPKMAISVYHHPNHLLQAFTLIKQCRSDYRFRLRHYTEGFAETVLYAY